jgi:uncharacterized membrane protein YozB (DUF420 family)
VDPKATYWTVAWINMGLIVILAGAGLSRAHHHRYAEHRRWMLASAGLVVLFVVSYAAKLWWLGRESLETWSPSYVVVLRIHELCVAAMLAGGGTALVQAHRFGLPDDDAKPEPGPARAHWIQVHRRAGMLAFAAAVCGVATAAYVLYGMYERLG